MSNPPYIRTEVIQGLEDEVKLHDPWIALDGHEDGLYFYRRIVSESISHLNDGAWLMFEIGHDQAEDVSKLMKNAGFCNRKFFIIVIFYHYGVIKQLFEYKMKQGDSKLAF